MSDVKDDPRVAVSPEQRRNIAYNAAHSRLKHAVETIELCERLLVYPQLGDKSATRVLKGKAFDRAQAAIAVLASDDPNPPPAAGPKEYIVCSNGRAEVLVLNQVLQGLPLNEPEWRSLVEQMPAGYMAVFGGTVLVVCLPAGTMKLV